MKKFFRLIIILMLFILVGCTTQTVHPGYSLDMGLISESMDLEEFHLSMIRIKHTDEDGKVTMIGCTKDMLSAEDYEKLQTPGVHSVTIKYDTFEVLIKITLTGEPIKDDNKDENQNDNDNQNQDQGDNGQNSDSNDENKEQNSVFQSENDYYKSANGLSGLELKKSLRQIITTTHKKTVTYAELKTYLQKADEDPNNPNNMILFYTGASVKKTSNMDIWNREHVWAQSLSKYGGKQWFGTSGAGADMHHLRPCNPGENSSRGNKKFGETSSYYDPSKHGADYRGDVARILFYMFTRYTESDNFTFKSVAESKEILLKWNKIDPVSETEIIRNNYTYEIQGNRNPFIDHPECADLIWGEVSKVSSNGDIVTYSYMYIIEKKKEYMCA